MSGIANLLMQSVGLLLDVKNVSHVKEPHAVAATAWLLIRPQVPQRVSQATPLKEKGIATAVAIQT